LDTSGHALARQPDLMPVPVNLLLSEEWQMIAIFTHDHLGQ
jgi:hypothetical protein